MSNCCGVVIVKARNNFYVGIVPGVANFEPEKLGLDNLEKFVSMLSQNGSFEYEDDAQEKALEEQNNFVRDFGCFPQYEISKWDLNNYLYN